MILKGCKPFHTRNHFQYKLEIISTTNYAIDYDQTVKQVPWPRGKKNEKKLEKNLQVLSRNC